MAASWTRPLSLFAAFGAGVGLGLTALFLLAPGLTRSAGDAPTAGEAAAAPITAPGDDPQPAPDFALPTLEGDTLRLSALRGKVVVLNFWATWCAPCRQEIPDFIKLQRELGAERVRFVGVSLDDEGFEVVRPYAEEMGINYPIVHDTGEVAARYGGIRVVPTTFLIGPEGKVHGYAPGMVTEDVLRPRLEELVALIAR